MSYLRLLVTSATAALIINHKLKLRHSIHCIDNIAEEHINKEEKYCAQPIPIPNPNPNYFSLHKYNIPIPIPNYFSLYKYNINIMIYENLYMNENIKYIRNLSHKERNDLLIFLYENVLKSTRYKFESEKKEKYMNFLNIIKTYDFNDCTLVIDDYDFLFFLDNNNAKKLFNYTFNENVIYKTIIYYYHKMCDDKTSEFDKKYNDIMIDKINIINFTYDDNEDQILVLYLNENFVAKFSHTKISNEILKFLYEKKIIENIHLYLKHDIPIIIDDKTYYVPESISEEMIFEGRDPDPFYNHYC